MRKLEFKPKAPSWLVIPQGSIALSVHSQTLRARVLWGTSAENKGFRKLTRKNGLGALGQNVPPLCLRLTTSFYPLRKTAFVPIGHETILGGRPLGRMHDRFEFRQVNAGIWIQGHAGKRVGEAELNGVLGYEQYRGRIQDHVKAHGEHIVGEKKIALEEAE